MAMTSISSLGLLFLKGLKDTIALYSRMESLTCQPLDNGNSAYFPNFCSELLLDADVLYEDLVKANPFLPRDASFMKYRGKPIKRSKFFINMTGKALGRKGGKLPRDTYIVNCRRVAELCWNALNRNVY